MHNISSSTSILIATLLFITTLSVSGCNKASSATSTEKTEASTTEKGDEHGHGHDDHGHDHSHGPAYKPDTFKKAVTELEHKLEHMQAGIAKGHLDHVETEVANMEEFINWLPELSGDSDMAKKEWDQVKNISTQMLEVCNNIKEELKKGKVSQESLKEFGELLQQQDKLVPYSIEKKASPNHSKSDDERVH